MPAVRIKKRPWEEIEVSDREYLDLKRQGLLVESPAPRVKRPSTPQPEPVGKTDQEEK